MQGMISVVVEVSPDESVVGARADRRSPILIKAAVDAAGSRELFRLLSCFRQPLRTTTINFDFNLDR